MLDVLFDIHDSFELNFVVLYLTGIDKFKYKAMLDQAKEAGIIGPGKEIHHSGWFDKEHGGLNFILDIMCMTGILIRVD